MAGSTVVSLVSPGTELAVYRSIYTEDAPLGSPAVPGYAAVFRIEEFGEDVKRLEVGQLVYGMGGHGSRQCLPADVVRALPARLPPAIAVFARLAAVNMTTLVTTRAQPPGPVLVLGLGVVGNLAAQVFQAASYEVVANDPVESRVLLARTTGVVNARATLEGAELPPFSLVVDCSGHEDAALQACRFVRKGGEVVLVGVPWLQRGEASAHDLLKEVFHRFLHLRSGWEWELPTTEEPWEPAEAPPPRHDGSAIGNQELALHWLATGAINVNGLGVEVAPEDAQQAYQALLRQEGPLTRLFRWAAD